MVDTRKGYLSNSKILQILTNHAKIKADYNHSLFHLGLCWSNSPIKRFLKTIIRIARLSKRRKDNKSNLQTFKYHKFKQKKKIPGREIQGIVTGTNKM